MATVAELCHRTRCLTVAELRPRLHQLGPPALRIEPGRCRPLARVTVRQVLTDEDHRASRKLVPASLELLHRLSFQDPRRREEPH
jgi:hypothetical protein